MELLAAPVVQEYTYPKQHGQCGGECTWLMPEGGGGTDTELTVLTTAALIATLPLFLALFWSTNFSCV